MCCRDRSKSWGLNRWRIRWRSSWSFGGAELRGSAGRDGHLDEEKLASTAPRGDQEASQSAVPDLGEFHPPADYEFEPEFLGDAPRPIPDELRLGPYGRGRRRGLYTLAWVVCVCLVGANLWLVKEVGKYILPFAYLSWIGWGAAAIWVAAFLRSRFS